MSTMASVIGPDYRVDLPREWADKLDLHPGDEVRFILVGRELRVVKKLRMEDMFGILKGYPGTENWTSLDELDNKA